MPKNSALKKIVKIIILLLIFSLGIGGGLLFNHKDKLPKLSIPLPKDKYVQFLSGVYDTIQTNYWEKITDEQLSTLYSLGIQKITNKQVVAPKTKKELEKLLKKELSFIKEPDKKKEFSVQLADIVLANLQPFGRSRLYSQKMEIDLKNTVDNKNPEVDQYKILNVDKNASLSAIQKTFEEKSSELEKSASPEAKQQLAQLNKAYEIIADPENRKTYDQSGIEPTLENKLIRPNIFYIHLAKFSPTTIDELFRVTSKVDKGDTLDTLILDFRDNIGGSIDGLPYFIGPFIGNDQYAYQFYHQGEKIDFKTKIGWIQSLIRYKKVIILINENAQSTAEVMVSTLKKYNVGILIGITTKGWGTVEKVFSLSHQIDEKEKFSVFLVHSVTLREDGQPIEGRGIEPTINIKDPNWENQLYSIYRNQELSKVIKEITGWE